MRDTIDIRGLDRSILLMRLFDAARSTGFIPSVIALSEPDQMTICEADEILGDGTGRTYVDYHRGRVLKCDVMEDDFRTALYDRDNGGEGAAARVIEKLRAGTAAE